MRTVPAYSIGQLPGISLLGTLVARVSGLLSLIDAALVARRQRADLMSLDDRMLADIGISRADAECEAARGLFDVPEKVRGWR